MRRSTRGVAGCVFLALVLAARPAAPQCPPDRRASWLGTDVVTYGLKSYPSHSIVTDRAIDRVIQESSS